MRFHRVIGPPLLVLAAAVSAAAPAAASAQDDYLRPLLARYAFLSSHQLLTEANRVCSTIEAGNGSSVAAGMVATDLQVSTAVSIDITSAAIRYLNC